MRPRVSRLASAVGLAFAASALLSAPPAVRAQEGLKLRTQPLLIDPNARLNLDARQPDNPGLPAFAFGDRMEGTTGEDVKMTGHAELRKTGSVIRADMIHYTQLDDEVFALGSVRIVRDGDVYTGPELRLRLDVQRGYFLDTEFTRNRPGDFPGRGSATRIDFQGKQRTALSNPLYTTCAPGNLDWYVRADSMVLDDETQSGEGVNGKLYFKGVPILAAPWFSFPLGQGRKSGFLPPTLSVTSKNGADVLIPYYWDIAPNRDLTLYPKSIGLRGFQIGAEFRYLEPTYSGTIRTEWLPNDRVADANRYLLSAQHNWSSGPWSASADINKVSDNNYFIDFSRNIASSSTTYLPRSVSLAYSSTYWSATTRVLRYQTLQDPLNPVVPPYDRLPQLTVTASRGDVHGFDFNLITDVTHFAHPTLVEGDRLVVNPSVSYPIIAPGFFVTPRLAMFSSQYQLSNPAAGTPRHLSNNVPTFSLDSGLVFERDTRLFGNVLRQTLEPRLFYVRTPYRDQSLLPNFDSGLTDFSFAQIFSENPFSGYDRIADANQLTAAVTSRLLDPDSGAELLRATLGQRFYYSPQRVVLPGGTPIDEKKSDFLAAFSAEVIKNITLDATLQYSQSIGGTRAANLGARWQPGPGKVINASYRFQRDSAIEQTDFSAQWPLGGGWSGVGRVNYSLRDRQVLESLGGIEYNGCCYVVRLVAQRFVTSAATSTTTMFLQLELNGFSGIGSSPMEALKRSVPGYMPTNPPPPAQSPFQNYE